VAVVDSNGTMLASGSENANQIGAAAARSDQFKTGFENRMKQTIESMLERSVGPGNVRAEVSAEIYFDRDSVNEETFDPDGQVVRSTQTVEESSSSTEVKPTVSVANNLPEGQGGQTQAQIRNSDARSEETVNFEISKRVRNHIRESGTVKRLSVAVLVDGRYQVDAETGERTYVPRSEEELSQIGTLVRSAIGYDESRGDTVEVVNMAFATFEEPEEALEPLFGLSKGDYFKIAQILVLALVAILVILLVLRPLVSRVFTIPERITRTGAPGALPGPPGTHPAIAGPEGEAGIGAIAIAGDEGAVLGAGDEDESLIDINKVEGRVRASSVKKVGEIIDKHPDEALTILRGWMAEGTA